MSDKRVFDNGDKAAGNKIEVHVIERMDKVDFSDDIPNFLDTKNINPADITRMLFQNYQRLPFLKIWILLSVLLKIKSLMAFVSRPLINTPHIKAVWRWMMNFHGLNIA